MALKRFAPTRISLLIKSFLGLLGLLCLAVPFFDSQATAVPFHSESEPRRQVIPILATTLDRHKQPVGIVAEIQVTLEERSDDQGMDIQFERWPGRFSRVAQVAVMEAISNIATYGHMNTDSLTVSLKVPYEGVTVYGESLSAMVGITVIALANGDTIQPSRVLTGTVAQDGHIGAVGGIGLKLKAAQVNHLNRVLVPEEYDQSDGDWNTPFLLHVSPVDSVATAYQALTDKTFPNSQGG